MQHVYFIDVNGRSICSWKPGLNVFLVHARESSVSSDVECCCLHRVDDCRRFIETVTLMTQLENDRLFNHSRLTDWCLTEWYDSTHSMSGTIHCWVYSVCWVSESCLLLSVCSRSINWLSGHGDCLIEMMETWWWWVCWDWCPSFRGCCFDANFGYNHVAKSRAFKL